MIELLRLLCAHVMTYILHSTIYDVHYTWYYVQCTRSCWFLSIETIHRLYIYMMDKVKLVSWVWIRFTNRRSVVKSVLIGISRIMLLNVLIYDIFISEVLFLKRQFKYLLYHSGLLININYWQSLLYKLLYASSVIYCKVFGYVFKCFLCDVSFLKE